MDRIKNILLKDKNRVEILKIVNELKLPQCYVAAGFIRNLIWDYTHGYISTKLNDIDVIYYNDNEVDNTKSLEIEKKLNYKYPSYCWDVKNQALMHTKNNDNKYKNTLDAMSYWPEKETAIGVRYIKNNNFEIITAFDIELQFLNTITHNPKRSLEVFNKRINNKNWLEQWPLLKIVN